MPGAIPIAPQLEETQVLNFERSSIAVGFFLDICMEDLMTLKKYYERALKNSVFLRLQNTMRVRQNDKYLVALEEEIGRLENRWVIPVSKAFNIFESATKFTDVSPQQEESEKGNPEADAGAEVVDVAKSEVQSKRRWIEEPTVVQLKSLGVKPYRDVMRRLRDLRHKRTQYKYLELFFLNLGRQVINLQSNLQLVIAVIKVVEDARKLLGEDGFANNPIGNIVKEIIAGSSLNEAVEKLENLDLELLLGKKGDGGPAGNEDAELPSANSQTAGARESIATNTTPSSGVGAQRGGDVPSRADSPPTTGPTGINPQGQKAPKNR